MALLRIACPLLRVFFVQEEYEIELEAVEEVFLQEREALLTANKVP